MSEFSDTSISGRISRRKTKPISFFVGFCVPPLNAKIADSAGNSRRICDDDSVNHTESVALPNFYVPPRFLIPSAAASGQFRLLLTDFPWSFRCSLQSSPGDSAWSLQSSPGHSSRFLQGSPVHSGCSLQSSPGHSGCFRTQLFNGRLRPIPRSGP